MHVLNLLEKFHSGSIDGHGTDSDSDDVKEDELEKLNDYGIGGNHAGYVGYINGYISETLSHRYVIVKKLGFGPYSCCWAARDCKLDIFVAIKIYKSSPFFRECALQECKVLLELNKVRQEGKVLANLQETLGVNITDVNTVKLLNTFSHAAANGTHCCLVLELLGPSLESILTQYNDYVRWPTTRYPYLRSSRSTGRSSSRCISCTGQV